MKAGVSKEEAFGREGPRYPAMGLEQLWQMQKGKTSGEGGGVFELNAP